RTTLPLDWDRLTAAPLLSDKEKPGAALREPAAVTSAGAVAGEMQHIRNRMIAIDTLTMRSNIFPPPLSCPLSPERHRPPYDSTRSFGPKVLNSATACTIDRLCLPRPSSTCGVCAVGRRRTSCAPATATS